VLKILMPLLLTAASATAFSLLGPYADWMQRTNGYRQAGDIGGPMDIHEEYRWTVPVVTYAFDKSFVDFFGSNGVAAVEQAIQIINDLPPASQIELTNYPTEVTHVNYAAEEQRLFDLKSRTLSLLLEQLGLAEPMRSVFSLRQWDADFFMNNLDETTWPPGTFPNYILERNFDPVTLQRTHTVNGTWYSGNVFYYGMNSPVLAEVIEFPVDPIASTYNAVADQIDTWGGRSFTGLTRDDVGGIRYLLNPTNINYEPLLDDVHPIGTNAGVYVQTAFRPGVDKITFVRREYDSILEQFYSPFTNRYSDVYLTNGIFITQQVERVSIRPDFLFRAGDLDDKSTYTFAEPTGTGNWLNEAELNGNVGGSGPGVIRPPVSITYHRLGPIVASGFSTPNPILARGWGSFDGTTNAPIGYPTGTWQPEQLTLHLFVMPSLEVFQKIHTWQATMPLGGNVLLETSTNLSDWVSLTLLTNQGTVVNWIHDARSVRQGFFRLVR
jgi:hypothetical protein